MRKDEYDPLSTGGATRMVVGRPCCTRSFVPFGGGIKDSSTVRQTMLKALVAIAAACCLAAALAITEESPQPLRHRRRLADMPHELPHLSWPVSSRRRGTDHRVRLRGTRERRGRGRRADVPRHEDGDRRQRRPSPVRPFRGSRDSACRAKLREWI